MVEVEGGMQAWQASGNELIEIYEFIDTRAILFSRSAAARVNH
jgi:hypothetical protein